jgi:hypothetical protein
MSTKIVLDELKGAIFYAGGRFPESLFPEMLARLERE